MSAAWGWYLFFGTIVTLGASLWLIAYTNRQRQSDDDIAESETHVWDEDIRELNNPLPMWWLWLFVGTIIFSAGYLAWYPGIGVYDGYADWSQEGQYEAEMKAAEERYGPLFAKFGEMSVEELVNEEQAMSIGSSLFANYCSQCHGSTGKGARGFPNLTDDDWQYGGSPAQIEQSIMQGRASVMPVLALGGEAEVNAMVDYVLSLPDGQDTSSPAHQQYMTLCIACHGPDGTGNQLLGAPNLTNDIWLYGSSPDDIRYTLLNGRNGIMPGHSELIGPDRGRILTAYVYSLSQ